MPEFLPRSILVTTDLSPAAAVAYPAARSLAVAYDAVVTVLTCLDVSVHLGESSSGLEMPLVYLPAAVDAAKARTEEELREHLLQHFPGMPAKHAVTEAARPVHHTIVEHIRRSEAELVVIASHGRTGISRALLGSVAEHVARHSHVPTLIIPSGKAE
jgi:nucleotide-binding universal stress UspA family protein